MTPIPKGPKNSQPKKRRAKAKAKLSEKTRNMLKAPVSQETSVPEQKLEPAKLEQYLPGVAAADGSAAYLHCACAYDADDNQCLAPGSRGARCKKRRTRGNFCRQHYLEWSSSEKLNDLWSSVKDSWESAQVSRLILCGVRFPFFAQILQYF